MRCTLSRVNARSRVKGEGTRGSIRSFSSGDKGDKTLGWKRARGARFSRLTTRRGILLLTATLKARPVSSGYVVIKERRGANERSGDLLGGA